jgi:hypothetical protein
VQYALVTVAQLCLLVYCLFDVLRTPAAQVRNLPKPVWAILCFVPPVLGPIAWLLFGRPPQGSTAPLPYRGTPGAPPQQTWVSPRKRAEQGPPDDDEAFLRSLKERAEQQRRAAEEQRRQRGESA